MILRNLAFGAAGGIISYGWLGVVDPILVACGGYFGEKLFRSITLFGNNHIGGLFTVIAREANTPKKKVPAIKGK